MAILSKISSYWCRDVAVPVFIMLTVFRPNIMSIELFRLYWYHMHFVVRNGWTWCIVRYAKSFGCYRKYREIKKKSIEISLTWLKEIFAVNIVIVKLLCKLCMWYHTTNKRVQCLSKNIFRAFFVDIVYIGKKNVGILPKSSTSRIITRTPSW